MDIFVFDTKSIKIDSRSYNTIYKGPTPMYITKKTTKMSREAAIIENTCVSNYAPRRNRPAYACWAVTAGIPVKFGTAHGRSRPEVGNTKCTGA